MEFFRCEENGWVEMRVIVCRCSKFSSFVGYLGRGFREVFFESTFGLVVVFVLFGFFLKVRG